MDELAELVGSGREIHVLCGFIIARVYLISVGVYYSSAPPKLAVRQTYSAWLIALDCVYQK